jgi:IS5 family transposase
VRRCYTGRVDICISREFDKEKKVRKKSGYDGTIGTAAYLKELEELQPVMEKVYGMTERHEILKEKVGVQEKIFSIYERHTDIIVKGKRYVQFGHKVQISGQTLFKAA